MVGRSCSIRALTTGCARVTRDDRRGTDRINRIPIYPGVIRIPPVHDRGAIDRLPPKQKAVGQRQIFFRAPRILRIFSSTTKATEKKTNGIERIRPQKNPHAASIAGTDSRDRRLHKS